MKLWKQKSPSWNPSQAEIDEINSDPEAAEQSKRWIEWHIRRDSRDNVLRLVVLVAVGIYASWLFGTFSALGRFGAILTAVSIFHAGMAFGIDVAKEEMERNDKIMALKADLRAVYHDMARSIQRMHIRANIQTAAFGTIIWGFADLLDHVVPRSFFLHP